MVCAIWAASRRCTSAGYIEQLGRTHSKPIVKQLLAAVRMLFDWLVAGQMIAVNPANAVRGPKHSVRKGKTSVLDASEMRDLLASIDTGTLKGLRDRALIAPHGLHFRARRGGKVTELPCHLDQFLKEWVFAAGLAGRSDAPLFPILRHGLLAEAPAPLAPSNVFRMVRKRAADAGLRTKISPHSFRGTGITSYLTNGGKLEVAQAMAGHESARTTGLYDRRSDALALF